MNLKDFTSALTVSFLTIAAGAAFGIWTGAGATLGIFSMAVASVIGVAFGGLPVKTSGPTGPTAGLMFATGLALTQAGFDPKLGMIVVLLSGIILFALSFLPVAKLIAKVPYVSLAIFVNGVSLFIIYKQLVKAKGFSDLRPSQFAWETGIVVSVVVLLYLWPRIARLIKKAPGSKIVSGSLFVMFIGALVTQLAGADVKTLTVDAVSLSSLIPDFGSMFSSGDFPTSLVLFLTLKMTLVLALVTVVTARALCTKDYYSRELRNQSLANILVAAIGGVPVTIGFIRTKLLEKTGATSPWAGVILGVMVVVIVLGFDFILELVPTSVFVGILIKAGLSSLDLQVWKDYRADSSRLFTLIFVTVGSLLIIWFDLVLVFLASMFLWWFIGKYILPPKTCRDIESCPCVG